MSEDADNKPKTWWRRLRPILVGVVLGLVCKYVVPQDYQSPCEAIVSLCTGSF